MNPRQAVGAVFLILGVFSVGTGLPVEPTTAGTTLESLDCNNETDLYDQRQNGTENYRIHVNGVVVLVAPAEAVLQAAQLGALQMGQDPETVNVTSQQPLKPKPKPPTATENNKVPTESHPIETGVAHPKEKNNLKLLNLLHMFRSMRHNSERD